MKPPCLDCDARHVGCHSKCKPYLEFKSELELIKVKKSKEADFMNYLCNSIKRIEQY